MPFFRDTTDGVDAISAAPEAPAERATATQPLPIHGLDHSTTLRYRPSEESIRTELCEGPLLPGAEGGVTSGRDESAAPGVTTTSDRAELIERLKRGESPTWVPSRRVCSALSFL